MTKAELIGLIQNSPLVKAVIKNELITEVNNIKTYDIGILLGDVEVNAEKISYYVVDEGLPTEAAYFRNNQFSKIQPVTPTPTFQSLMQAELAVLRAAGDVVTATLNNLDELSKTATVTVYVPDPNWTAPPENPAAKHPVLKEEWIVWLDENGIQYNKIV